MQTVAGTLDARLSALRVAIVHDWLTGMRGGEKVLEALCRICPSAEIVTIVHVRGSVSPLIEGRRIRTSLVQRLPNPGRWYREYLPVFPTAIECLDFDAVDLIVSSSHCAAKAVVPTGRAVHVCYCHTPMRYVWDQFESYFGPERIGRWPSTAARRVARWLAQWDRETSTRVNRFVANSAHVAGRIARYYNRAATVVHPPVDTAFFTIGPPEHSDGPFLVVSALVPYKRVDVAIRAATKVGARLKIVGTGPDESRLKEIAGPGIEFAGTVSETELRDAYRSARALVLPAEEDFGIAPVESLACGRPVIALGRGGARETVEPGVTGMLVEEPSVDAFAAAMHDSARLKVDPLQLRARAERFSVERFEGSFRHVLEETLMTGNGGAW